MNSATLRSLAVIAIAAIATTVAWGIFKAAGADFELKESAGQDTVRGIDVVIATVIAGGLAYLVHRFLERKGHARWWPFIGSTAIAVSMVGPSYYADGATAMALMALHFVAGVALIVGFALTGSRGCGDERATRFEPAADRR